jgi:hypothetical protein
MSNIATVNMTVSSVESEEGMQWRAAVALVVNGEEILVGGDLDESHRAAMQKGVSEAKKIIDHLNEALEDLADNAGLVVE